MKALETKARVGQVLLIAGALLAYVAVKNRADFDSHDLGMWFRLAMIPGRHRVVPHLAETRLAETDPLSEFG